MERRQIWAWAVIMVLLAVAQTVPARRASKVSLAWDASAGDRVAGYRIYYSRVPGQYKKSQSVKVGKVTHYTLDLPPGPWYLAVTAYDAKGHESGYSNSACWQCPSKPVQSKIHTGNDATPSSRCYAPAAAAVSTQPTPVKRNRPLRLAPRRDDHIPGTLIPPSVAYKNIK